MANIPEIRDIYIPDSVSIFPLAYGWWVVLVIFISAFVLVKTFLWSVKISRKAYALNQLDNIDTEFPVSAAVNMSELLRRICNVKYKGACSLYGREWIDFLNEHAKQKISGDEANLLIFAPFMDINDTLYDEQTATNLKDFCKHWIGANL